MIFLRVVPEMPLNSFSAAHAASMDDRAIISRARARRHWVARTGLILGATGLLLMALVTWRRDAESVALSMRITQRGVTALQAHLDATGLLPSELPSVDPTRYVYATYADRFYAQRTSRPVIIAASAPLSLILRSNGRCVIIYENGKVHAEWLTLAQFGNAFDAQLADAAAFERQRQGRIPQLPP